MADIETSGFDEFIKDLDNLGDFTSAEWRPLIAAVERSTLLVEDRAKRNLTENESVAYGELRAGIGHQVIVQPLELSGIVGTSVNHARYVEYGTRPHWPPLEPLVEWVRVKRLATGPAIARVAWAVRVKIAKFGTQARPYFEPAIESSRSEILRMIQQAFDEIIRRFNAK